MVNQQRSGETGMDEALEHAEDLLEERLRSYTFECPLHSLSDVIRRHDVRGIDLLKVDVQKSELEVLRGIDDEHWPRIRPTGPRRWLTSSPSSTGWWLGRRPPPPPTR